MPISSEIPIFQKGQIRTCRARIYVEKGSCNAALLRRSDLEPPFVYAKISDL
jgi:hypothetical protein